MPEPMTDGAWQRAGPVPLDPRLLHALVQASDAHTGMPERLNRDIQQLLAALPPQAVTTSTPRPWGSTLALLVLIGGAGLATWYAYWQHGGQTRHPPTAAPAASAPLVAEAPASSPEASPISADDPAPSDLAASAAGELAAATSDASASAGAVVAAAPATSAAAGTAPVPAKSASSAPSPSPAPAPAPTSPPSAPTAAPADSGSSSPRTPPAAAPSPAPAPGASTPATKPASVVAAASAPSAEPAASAAAPAGTAPTSPSPPTTAAAAPPAPPGPAAPSARRGEGAAEWSKALQLPAIADVPWRLGLSFETINRIELDGRNRDATARNCRELLAALDAGLLFALDQDVPAANFEAVNCRAIALVGRAARPASSQVDGFKLDAANVARLPVEVATSPDAASSARLAAAAARGQSLPALFPDLIVRPNGATLLLAAGNWESRLHILARGDFDLDGRDDLLLSVIERTVDNRYENTKLFIVTRDGADQPLRVVRRVH